MTIAIASLLNLDQTPESKKVWDLMEERCTNLGMNSIPIPHLSWQVAEDYATEALVSAISNLVRDWKQFPVKTTGLGLFSGESPVLYLPIIKTKDLLNKHEQLWELCSGYAKDISFHYSPDNWVPHVTIIHQNFSLENASCVISDLYDQDLNMEFQVQKIEVIYQNENEEGIKAEFALQKG